jgi:hypothetical protein
MRRLPPPWSVEELEACFIVTDNAGQKLAYVYFEDEPGRRSAAKLMDAKTKKADDHDGHESGNEAVLNEFGDTYDPN